MTAHWSDAQVEAAEKRGREMLETEPRALAARYDVKANRIVVDLGNGATFAFPPRLAERLADATPEQLAEVEIAGAGFGLHWPSLDEDLWVPALLGGVFGTKRWMSELTRRAGQSRPPPPRRRQLGRMGASAGGRRKRGELGALSP